MMSLKSTLLGLVFVAMADSAAVLKAAPPHDLHGFTYIGSTSYNETTGALAKDFYLSPAAASHPVAQSTCYATFGGILAAVLTATQNNELRMFVEMNQLCLHIGGERDTAGVYYWTSLLTPIRMSYTNWQASQPNSATGSCVCVHGSGAAFGWHTCSCTTSYRYICEL